MSTVNRTIETDQDRLMAARLVENRPYPFTLTITDGKHRSTAQNRLQHMWMKEISEQRGDVTPEEAKAYCKLTIGVPILRSQNEAFRVRYDEVLKPLSYEQKLAIMSEPLDLPVTRLMSTRQLTEYLDGIIRHFGEQGVVLTMPDEMRDQLNSNPAGDAPSEPAVYDAAPSASESDGESPASSLSPLPQPAFYWLPTVARMLWAATNTGGDTDANLDLLNNQRLACAELEVKPTDAERDKAGSIYRVCKDVVLGTTKKSDALKIIAGHAGIEIGAI